MKAVVVVVKAQCFVFLDAAMSTALHSCLCDSIAGCKPQKESCSQKLKIAG